MKVYDTLFRRGLTRLDAEKAHQAAFRAIRSAAPVLARTPHRARRPVQTMGLRFPNRLGLAAGFDKSAIGIDALAALGFGHVEIGTVTARPQPGNPKPRLFRLPADDAILNRMGFNNDGAQAVADRLAARMGSLRSGNAPLPVLGVNIGKSKVVPEEDEQAVLDDYGTSTSLLARFADYLVVNVSSPNTPGLRNLQAVDRLGPLLRHVAEVSERVVTDRAVPLLVKIAPDLNDEDVDQVADLAVDLGLAGIIATNTTISRAGLRTPAAEVEALGAGGISGAPVAARSLEVLRLLHARVGDRLTLISVGGISDGAQAAERIRAGASLVQAYSGFIYGGPRWPARLLDGLGHAETTGEDAR